MVPQSSRYPNNVLYPISAKTALLQHLVTPVVATKANALAFRVVWRGEHWNTEAWQNILNYRECCDEIVRRAPGVQFFVSCITSIYNKPQQKGALPACFYPAVAYWTVFNETFQYDQLAATISQHVDFPEIKTIGRSCAPNVGLNASGLFMALKDHNGGFIRAKLAECLAASGMTEGQIENARIVRVSKGPWEGIIEKALPHLLAAKLCIEWREDVVAVLSM